MTALTRPAEPQGIAVPMLRALAYLFSRPVAWLAACHETVCQRSALERLSDARLRDIGLTRADVEHEVRRPFWDW